MTINWHNVLHRADRTKARSRLKRRGFPLRAYVGANGSGKSLAAVYDLMPSLDAGRPVLSTVRILDYRNPRPCEDPTCTFPSHPDHQAAHPLWTPLKDYQQILDARDTDILLDEVQGVASSRDFASLPSPIVNILLQLRRRNVTLSWTTPNWARADKVIREVTHIATLCEGYAPKTRTAPPGEPPMLWRDRRLFLWRSYDAVMLDDFDARGADLGAMRPIINQAIWRPGSLATIAYDTYDMVLALSDANDSGICIGCGGRRAARKCTCNLHAPREPKLIEPLPQDPTPQQSEE